MTTISAALIIEVRVECPHCEELVDLMNPEDTDGDDLNEEGRVISQACPDGSWHEAHKQFSVPDVTCTACGNHFTVKGIEW